MLLQPVATPTHTAPDEFPCASDFGDEAARGHRAPDTSPGSDIEAELDSAEFIAELNSARGYFQRVFKPLKMARVTASRCCEEAIKGLQHPCRS